MRRRIITAFLCALVFCGVAAAATGDPKVEIVPADQAWADSLVLTSSDVGAGWNPESTIGGEASGESAPGGSSAAPDMTD